MRLLPSRISASYGKETETPPGAVSQEVLIVCDGRDLDGLQIMQNVCTALSFGKMQFTMLDIARSGPWPLLGRFAAMIVCTERFEDLDAVKAGRVEDYVRGGGGLMVAYRCWNEHLCDLLGFPGDDGEPKIRVTSGLVFAKEILPGAHGLRIEDQDFVFENGRFDISAAALGPDCTVLASDLDGNPILWRRAHGAGRVVYWNTDELFCRALRGFILQTALASMGTGVAAAGGFAMFHVDDFPTSLSDARLEPVATEFSDLDWDGFMFDVWHADMMALRRKHGLKYTWYAIMNYHDIDTGPDPDLDAVDVTTGADVLRRRLERAAASGSDDEYGLHGYNHVPLMGENWPDRQALCAKMQLARDLWDDIMPAARPTSWVPANNWYDADCLPVVAEVFPEISAVCGLHSSGKYRRGGYREFGPEPWQETLLCLPRETYGYVMAPELRMMLLSQIAGMGVWTHFIHPDDIFDIPTGPEDDAYRRNPDTRLWRATNGQGLAGLLPMLDDWIGEGGELYPWLEFVTTTQAEERYRAHVGKSVDVTLGDETVEIVTDREGVFFVRTGPETVIVPAQGGEVLDARPVEGGVLSTVRCPAGRTVFRIGG